MSFLLTTAASRSADHVIGANALAQAAVKMGVDKVKQFGIDQAKQGLDKAKQIGLDQAKQIAGETFKNMKLPGNLPLQFPTTLTPKGVADAAYNTGKRYAEDQIQKATGLPIKLPTSVSVEAIGKSFASLIPKDIASLVDTALSVGAQAAASAITTALAGAGLGSMVPGLGTIVGLGVALGVGAIKNALKEKPEDRNKALRKCHVTLRDVGGSDIPDKSPMELMPWVAIRQRQIGDAIAADIKKHGLCGMGEVVDFGFFLQQLAYQLFLAVKDTPQVLGLPQLERLIPLYEKVPTGSYKPGYAVQRGYALGYILQGTPASMNSLGAKTAAVPAILPAMRARRDALRVLVAKADNVKKLPANELSGLRWNLATELQHAAVQYQFEPTAENEQWLLKLATYFAALEQREASDRAAAAKAKLAGEKRQKERYAQDPAWKLADERANVFFQCSDGICPTPALAKRYAELKAMPASAFVPAPVPKPRPKPAAKPAPTFADYERMLRAAASGDADLIIGAGDQLLTKHWDGQQWVWASAVPAAAAVSGSLLNAGRAAMQRRMM